MLHLPTVIYSPWLSSSFVLCIHLYILFFVEKGASTFSVFTFRFTHGLTCFPPLLGTTLMFLKMALAGECDDPNDLQARRVRDPEGLPPLGSSSSDLSNQTPRRLILFFSGRGEAHLIIPPNYPSIRTATSTLHMAHRGPLFASCSFVESIKWLNTGSTNYLDGRFRFK